MSDQPKYQANFPGQFMGSQVAVGEKNKLEQHVDMTAGGRLTSEETARLTAELATLRERVTADVPPERRQAAIDELAGLKSAVVGKDSPDPSRLKRVHTWFLNNAPDLAGAVASLLLGPLVGKIVAGGTGAMAAAFGASDEPHGAQAAPHPTSDSG